MPTPVQNDVERHFIRVDQRQAVDEPDGVLMYALIASIVVVGLVLAGLFRFF